MKLLMFAFVLTCWTAELAAAQALTPSEIDAAIEAGQTGKEKPLVLTCEAVVGFKELFRAEKAGHNPLGSFAITMALSTGRIALMSAEAKRFYKPFAASQVPAELKTMAAFVVAEPRPPDVGTTAGSYIVPSPIEQVVIRAWPKRDRFVVPTELVTGPLEWPNVGGAPVRANRVRARFAVGEIRELTLGELEVVVVTQAGERTCSIRSGDRKRVFGR
jgi:hypothetical protein